MKPLEKPTYYDGSGSLNLNLPWRAENTVVVKPEVKVPLLKFPVFPYHVK